MRRPLTICTILLALALAACQGKQAQSSAGEEASPPGKQVKTESGEKTFIPDEGYVPDEKTAIRIAVAVWEPIYGETHIADEKPYHATLKNGVWTVEGSLPHGQTNGGTAIAKLAKSDGRILLIIHEK